MNLSTMYNTFNNRLRGRPSLLFHNRLILQRYGAWATSDVTLNTGSYTGTYLSNVRHNTEVNYDHGWDWDYKRNTKMFLLVSAIFWKRYIFKASKIFGACLIVSYLYSFYQVLTLLFCYHIKLIFQRRNVNICVEEMGGSGESVIFTDCQIMESQKLPCDCTCLLIYWVTWLDYLESQSLSFFLEISGKVYFLRPNC